MQTASSRIWTRVLDSISYDVCLDVFRYFFLSSTSNQQEDFRLFLCSQRHQHHPEKKINKMIMNPDFCHTLHIYTNKWMSFHLGLFYAWILGNSVHCLFILVERCDLLNVLLNSNFGSSTRGERQFLKVFRNRTKLTTPQRSVHLEVQSQLLTIMVGPQLLTIMVGPQLQLSASMSDNPTVGLHGLMSTFNWLFFKIFKFSGTSLPGMTSFTLQPHFLSGVYYDNCDCHILCVRA